MTRRLPIVLSLLAAIVVFAPRPAPRPHPETAPATAGVEKLPGSGIVAQGGTGASPVRPPSSGSSAGPATSETSGPRAAPITEIGEPASAVNPDYTAPPDPPVTPASIRGGGVTGTATFYKYHPGQAAAARLLREHYGSSWRGAVITVTGPAGQAVVVLSDFESSLIPGRLIDLDSHDFQRVCGQLSIGTCLVSVAP